MEQYAAGIVLYNPDITKLKENIDAISFQVKTVYCFNNGSVNISDVRKLLNQYNNVVLIDGKRNLGIATALNKIIERAYNDKIEWILTLDQDSIVCEGMIDELATLTKEEKVMIICPLIEDVRRKNEKSIVVRNTSNDIDFCITSGSFMNIKKTLEIGGFDDWLFIGLVDNEICYRAIQMGYRIIRNNAVVLNHELGDLTPSKYEKLFLCLGNILHSNTIKKLSYKRAVNPMRLYYATRNMVYLNKKYPRNTVPVWSSKHLVINCISNIIRGKRKLTLLKAIFCGLREGKKVEQGGK